MSISEKCTCDYCGNDIEIDSNKIEDWKYTDVQFGIRFRYGTQKITCSDNVCDSCGIGIYDAMNKVIKERLKCEGK